LHTNGFVMGDVQSKNIRLGNTRGDPEDWEIVLDGFHWANRIGQAEYPVVLPDLVTGAWPSLGAERVNPEHDIARLVQVVSSFNVFEEDGAFVKDETSTAEPPAGVDDTSDSPNDLCRLCRACLSQVDVVN